MRIEKLATITECAILILAQERPKNSHPSDSETGKDSLVKVKDQGQAKCLKMSSKVIKEMAD